jgi:DNA-binding beta-propeller fold protein YncE
VSTLSAAREFKRPAGVAIDGGRLFVTDSENHTVVSLDTGTGELTAVAGRAMTPGAADGVGEKPRGARVGGKE